FVSSGLYCSWGSAQTTGWGRPRQSRKAAMGAWLSCRLGCRAGLGDMPSPGISAARSPGLVTATSRLHVQRPDDAKTVAAAEIVVVAIARTRFIRGPVPEAAAHHVFGAVALQPRRAVGRRVLGVALVETILGPFHDVAVDL